MARDRFHEFPRELEFLCRNIRLRRMPSCRHLIDVKHGVRDEPFGPLRITITCWRPCIATSASAAYPLSWSAR